MTAAPSRAPGHKLRLTLLRDPTQVSPPRPPRPCLAGGAGGEGPSAAPSPATVGGERFRCGVGAAGLWCTPVGRFLLSAPYVPGLTFGLGDSGQEPEGFPVWPHPPDPPSPGALGADVSWSDLRGGEDRLWPRLSPIQLCTQSTQTAHWYGPCGRCVVPVLAHLTTSGWRHLKQTSWWSATNWRIASWRMSLWVVPARIRLCRRGFGTFSQPPFATRATLSNASDVAAAHLLAFCSHLTVIVPVSSPEREPWTVTSNEPV